MNNKRAATIYDIAVKAEVAAATVSKVLNGKGTVSEKTKAKIFKIAEELGYAPNIAAKNLRKSRSNQILLIIPEFSNMFYFDLVSAVHQVCIQNGYSMVLHIYNDTSENDNEYLGTLYKTKFNFVDAVINISFQFTEAHIEALKSIHKPVAISTVSCCNLDYPCPFDFVGADTFSGIYQAVIHLIQQGHRNISYVGLSVDSAPGKERYEGYKKAMLDSNLPLQQQLIFTGGYTSKYGFECGKRIAAQDMSVMPTAVCTANDMIAQGLYRALGEENIRIPNQMALVSMDNTDISDLLSPTLSSVAIMQYDIGRVAAEYVIDRLNGDKSNPHVKIFEPKLYVRQSTMSI